MSRGLLRLYTERPRSIDHGDSFPLSTLENPGETDIQLKANVENQDRTKCGKNEAGGMKSSGCRARKHVRNRAADDRPMMPSTIVQKSSCVSA